MMNYLLLLTIKSGQGPEISNQNQEKRKEGRSFLSSGIVAFHVRHAFRMKALTRRVFSFEIKH